jgi:transcriptional accessory protein Tex/SPT6
VSDVLVEGQEVQTWIKKLDRERNRISLTLIDPGTKTIRDLAKGDLVNGTVTRMMPYGAFVDIGIGRDALLHVREMGERYVAKPEDVVKIGDEIEARVIEVSRRRGRVDLSIKGLREEPEPEPMPEPVADKAASEQATPEAAAKTDEPADQFAELEVLTPMELAFKRAMEAEGIELIPGARKQSKRNRRDQSRMIQEEIIARTLSSPRK